MRDISATLQRVGLTRNEVKVYLALLNLGSSKAGTIAKKAYLDRTSTYTSITSLLQKGLISYVFIGKVKWFQAADPANLKKFLTNKLEDLEEILPSLKTQQKMHKLKSNVRLFKGVKGIKTVLNDILEEEKSNCLFGSEGQLEENMPSYAKKFTRELKMKKIVVHSLIRSGRKDAKSKNVRYVPKTVRSPVVTNIYGNKISLIIWSETPEAILIENKAAADAYRSYFNFMWEKSEKKRDE